MENSNKEIISDYKKISTSTIGHIISDGYLPDVKPIHRCGQTYVGSIITVVLTSSNTRVIRHALEIADIGDVLLIDARVLGERACWGALRTCAAIYEKLSAIVILGKVTDSLEIEHLGLPVFAHGVSALTTYEGDGKEGRLNTPVNYQYQCYETKIYPGNIAVLDDDGVFILSDDTARDILVTCQRKQTEDNNKLQLFLDQYKPIAGQNHTF